MAFRVGGKFFIESFLREIIGSLGDDSIGRILDITTVLYERNKLPAYVFLVELDGDIGMVLRPTTPHGNIIYAYSVHPPGRTPAQTLVYRRREAADRRCL